MSMQQLIAAAVQLITDKTNAAELGVFALLVNVTPTKNVQNSMPLHKFRQKLANSDVTKETLNGRRF